MSPATGKVHGPQSLPPAGHGDPHAVPSRLPGGLADGIELPDLAAVPDSGPPGQIAGPVA